MENATKALLIAAAVLVTIVIIAVGVLLLGNTSDVSEDAEKVGDAVALGTEEAVIEIQGGVYLSEEQFMKLLNDMGCKPGTHPDVFSKTYADRVFVMGYLLQGKAEKIGEDDYKWYDKNDNQVFLKTGEALLEEWIPEKLKKGQVKALKNPGNIGRIKQELKSHRDVLEETFEGKAMQKAPLIFFNCFDKDNNFVTTNSNEVAKVIYIMAVYYK